jgi:AAA+ ATPase superfamily predicted ATPase
MKAIVNDIIGRNREIQELRVILEQTSVVMSSTRRMGKTMILTKIDEIHHPGTKTMLCFVESIQSAE